MTGFLLQWPTIPTLVMFPVLVIVYTRLARSEEREVAARFGQPWAAYAARTPAFVPAGLRHPAAAAGRRHDGHANRAQAEGRARAGHAATRAGRPAPAGRPPARGRVAGPVPESASPPPVVEHQTLA